MKKKILASLSIAAAMVATTMPAMAANSEGDVTETKEITEDVAKEACEVYAELGSSFTVTIPKKITLSGADKTGSYSVSCTGDIAGDEWVSVVPDASFAMKQTGKKDVTASVTQAVNRFRGDNYTGSLLADGSEAKMADGATGSISAADLSAGAWKGTFNFVIALNPTASSSTETSAE